MSDDFPWQSAGATHVGNVRTVNEDAFLDDPNLGLWVVADGMGGHKAGDFASRAIIESFLDVKRTDSSESFLNELLHRLQTVNEQLQQYAASNQGGVVGSTVALLFLYDDRYTCLWAGDSRVYLLRDDQLQQLTRDHSEVEELIKLGMLARNQADSHPGGNVITRAVGAADSLAVDMVSRRFRDGDRYLLCSDGLNKVVSDRDIAEIVRDSDCRETPNALLDEALKNGARDNVTAVVVEINESHNHH